MARLQILELPEGAGDDRPPFVLVVDQVPTEDVAFDSLRRDLLGDGELAPLLGARAVLCFEGTVDIPANDVGEQAKPLLRVGEFEARDADAERKAAITAALGMDRTRDWDDVQHAARRVRRQRDELREESLRRGKVKAEYAECIRKLEAELDEARQWARHGYEIGQKHCGWSDHGVAPDWLTEGWPRAFDTCEHLKQAAEFDEALTRVRNLPTGPDVMDSQQERPDIWLDGYHSGVLAAKSATRPRSEPARASEDRD